MPHLTQEASSSTCSACSTKAQQRATHKAPRHKARSNRGAAVHGSRPLLLHTDVRTLMRAYSCKRGRPLGLGAATCASGPNGVDVRVHVLARGQVPSGRCNQVGRAPAITTYRTRAASSVLRVVSHPVRVLLSVSSTASSASPSSRCSSCWLHVPLLVPARFSSSLCFRGKVVFLFPAAVSRCTSAAA